MKKLYLISGLVLMLIISGGFFYKSDHFSSNQFIKNRIHTPSLMSDSETGLPLSGGIQHLEKHTISSYRHPYYGLSYEYPADWQNIIVGSPFGLGPTFVISQEFGGSQPFGNLSISLKENVNPKKLSIKDWYESFVSMTGAVYYGSLTSGDSIEVIDGELTQSGVLSTEIFTGVLNHEGLLIKNQESMYIILVPFKDISILKISYKYEIQYDSIYSQVINSIRW